ncbi:prephenate dehydratase [Ornithinimicrobium cryptoxanthini]|uniref:prephenate dehydratase n=1 Tax=Ornithinimicrobium cryptoxanthini TaxID=2934161 RepID=UPI00211827C4|nr:prephenate dehydratase [Ornithinimicrobium cryptoxanthini]
MTATQDGPPDGMGYLGPAGTFTEEALRRLDPEAAATAWAAPTVQATLEALRAGTLSAALVPFESSVEGSVSATLDELIRGEPLVITGEVHVEVQFALMVRPGTSLADVRRIATHPMAQAQTRDWVARELPGAEVIPESSTARAAVLVAAEVYDAAIAAPLAAERHELEILVDGIADRPGAVTRFIRLARPGPVPAPTGTDLTTVVAYLRHNHAGALLDLLNQFAMRGVDLVRLESRPTGEALGQYCFAIEALGHLSEPRMADALTGLRRVCADVRFLGSYPRAHGSPTRVPDVASARAYQDAQGWVEGLSWS